MSVPDRIRRTAAVGGGLAALAALAGCAPTTSTGTSTSAEPSTAAASAAPSASASALKDGTYTASGEYQSPGGLSKVGVTVTLANGTITAVKVQPEAQNATARQYESQFASGIGAVAVGKPIAGLKVGAVSGSSLTSQGFAKALAAIQADAAA